MPRLRTDAFIKSNLSKHRQTNVCMKNRCQCWDVAPQPQSQKIQQPTSPQKPLKDLPPNRLRSKWQRIQGWNIQQSLFCYKSIQSTIQSTATSSTNKPHWKTRQPVDSPPLSRWWICNSDFWGWETKCLYLWDLSKNVCNVDIHVDWQACGVWLKCQNVRFAFAVNRFCSSRVKTQTLEHYDFHSSQASIHPSIFSSSRSFSAQVLLATQQPQTPTRRHYDAMSNCKPKRPRGVFFFVHLLVFLVEHGHWSSFFDVFPCTIHLLNTSNNGSMAFAPQTTSKMISLSIVFFVVDLGHLESLVRVILVTTRQEH